MKIEIGSNLKFKRGKWSRLQNCVVLDLRAAESGVLFAVKIRVGFWNPFWVKPGDLSEPAPDPRSADPDGVSPAERRLFGIVSSHAPITTSAIAQIVNGDPAQEKRWTASTAGVIARRLESRGRLKMERKDSSSRDKLFTVELADAKERVA